MKIYRLTELGWKIAKWNTTAPNTNNWAVIFALKELGGGATFDQIVLQSGLDDGSTSEALGTLRRKQLITEN